MHGGMVSLSGFAARTARPDGAYERAEPRVTRGDPPMIQP